jgi:HAD superfamily hydrolase (TIGR01509 family)
VSEPRAVVFDMDGVLVDSGRHHRAAWRAMLRDIGAPEAAPDFWRLTIGRPANEAMPLLLGRAVPRAEAMHLARLKQEHYRRLAGEGAVAVPGAVEFVERLVARGIPRAVSTSASRADARRILRELGLARHFDVVVTADDVWRGKPDPEVYLTAADAIRIAPARCVVFEDALVGIEAARTAGMRVIGVSTAHTDAELTQAGAERVIASFEGLAWPP